MLLFVLTGTELVPVDAATGGGLCLLVELLGGDDANAVVKAVDAAGFFAYGL